MNYNESRWSKLIPSLLEIAILNLHISFKTNFFSEKDLENIISDLKSNFTKKLRKKELTMKADLDAIIIQKSKNSKKIMGGNSYNENESEYNGNPENINRHLPKTMNKSNYAISYDKNLRPEIIEKTELKKTKKGKQGKIIKRMTEEEYNAQYDSQGEERKTPYIQKNNIQNQNQEELDQYEEDEDNNNINEEEEENNEQKGFYDEQGNYHQYMEENTNENNNYEEEEYDNENNEEENNENEQVDNNNYNNNYNYRQNNINNRFRNDMNNNVNYNQNPNAQNRMKNNIQNIIRIKIIIK